FLLGVKVCVCSVLRKTIIAVFAAIDAAPIHDELASIGEGVFDRIGIEILIHIRLAVAAQLVMATAQRLGLDRPGVLHPTKMINMMDVKIAVAPAARPQKTVETL